MRIETGRRLLWVALVGALVGTGCGDDGAGAPADADPDPARVDAPPGTPLTPVFFSDWRTMALGMSNAVVSDGDKWNFNTGGDRGEIIDAPEGFPTAHALRVAYRNDGFVILRRTDLPVPAIGATRNYRWYYRHDQPDWPMDNSQHPIQDGNAGGDISWAFNTHTLSDTTWQNYFAVQVNSGENPFETGRWYSPILTTGTVYRYELQVHRTGEMTFQLHAQLHDSAGVLLHDDSGFTNSHAGGASSLADLPTFTFNQDVSRPYYGADTLNGINAGCNGVTGVTEEGFPYAVQAAFAVVDGIAPGTFIGPYGSVDGEVP